MTKKKEIEIITQIADLEAECNILEILITEGEGNEKASLWKKDLKKSRTRLTKLKKKLDSGEEEPIEYDILLNNRLTLENQLKIKKFVNENNECVVKFRYGVSDEFLRLLEESLCYQVKVERLTNDTIKCLGGRNENI